MVRQRVGDKSAKRCGGDVDVSWLQERVCVCG
jgi:hypothetical protein